MINIMRITRRTERETDAAAIQAEGTSSHPEQAASGGNLSGVSASVYELMAPEKRKTLLLGPSVVSKSTIDFYISKGYFKERERLQAPGGGNHSCPKEGEVVVFRVFFYCRVEVARGPYCSSLLAPFNVKLHHFTPNAMVQLSKFVWAVQTFGGEVLVDAFCRLFQLHCQGLQFF